MNILSANNISKSFGGLMAVGGLSFELQKEEILALIGPNCAGKTTVFNALTASEASTGGFTSKDDIGALLEELQNLYAGRGINLMKVAGKWAFRTAPACRPRPARAPSRSA